MPKTASRPCDEITIRTTRSVPACASRKEWVLAAAVLGSSISLIDESVVAAGADFIWLHVDVSNASAVRLYEAHGYVNEGRRENFYETGRDAFVYAKGLGL